MLRLFDPKCIADLVYEWHTYNVESLHFLVSPLPGTATGYTVSDGSHNVNVSQYDHPLCAKC